MMNVGMMNTTETLEHAAVAAAATFSTSTSARSANGDVGRFRPTKRVHDSWEQSWLCNTIAKPGAIHAYDERQAPSTYPL